MKLGLISGTGELPLAVFQGAEADGYEVYVAQIEGERTFGENGADYTLGEFGKMTRDFKKAKVTHVCFAGSVSRPDFRKLKPDFKTLTLLPGVVKAAKDGDDALLSYVVKTFEKEGFTIISPQELCKSILMPAGHFGAHKMENAHREDAEKAMKLALEIGAMDIGQGVVVCRGLVLAVEAQEGTDAMLGRVALLPSQIRGTEQDRAGVLAKMIKPGQETRVDLPTIGPETIDLAAAAGLAGIITEANKAFVLHKEQVIKQADDKGLFVVGLPPLGS